MSVLQNKKILLGVSGGIAAYKSAYLARRLIDEGATVRVVMSPGALAFIQPMTFQALTGNPVHTELLDPEAEAAMGHIELARWADYILIAPASANTLAKLAHGMASDLLSTLCLASDLPVYLAPAMNRLMWSHPATIANCDTLTSRGVVMFGPAHGDKACGETGAGRMLEPEDIRDQLIDSIQAVLDGADANAARESSISGIADKVLGQHDNDQNQPSLNGKRVLITAGPTREAIDPVRYISNRSSGKMGFAVAHAALAAGATVTLVAGPVSLTAQPGIRRIDVVSAQDMLDEVISHASDSDVFISVAAVSDYRLEQVMDQKIKKSDEQMQLSLVRNPDILQSVSTLPKRPFCVGFAAETEQVERHARGKMERKKLDMIAANHVAQANNPVFGSDTNALDVYWPGTNGHAHIPAANKQQIAQSLIKLVAQRLDAQ